MCKSVQIALRHSTEIGLEGVGLYIALAEYADNTGVIEMTQRAIADNLKADRRTIARQLKKLEEVGLIQINRNSKRSEGNAYEQNTYILTDFQGKV